MHGLLELGCQDSDSRSSYMAQANPLASPRLYFLFCKMEACPVKN